MLDCQSTLRGEALYEVLGRPTAGSEFAKYTTSAGNNRSRPRQYPAYSRALICRLYCWCAPLLITLSFWPILALSGCEMYVVNRGDAGDLVATPNSVNFGAVSIGQTASTIVSVLNRSSAPVEVTHVSLTGQSFSVVGSNDLPATIAAGGIYTLNVQFNPAAIGTATGQLTIASNSSTPGTPVISLSGTGTTGASLPALSALSCSSGVMTGSGTDVCTITLTTSAPSGGLMVNLSSSNSAVMVPSVVTVPADAVSAGFTATISSVTNAQTATMTASTGGTLKSFTLQLNAAILALSINATSIAFGEVPANTSATQPVILTSTGTFPVTINGANVTGTSFRLSGPAFPTTLNPGQQATLNIEFDPTAADAESGQLTITSNSSTNGTAVIDLTGTGTTSGTFTYAGSPLVNSLIPIYPSTPIQAQFFGMTIHNLASNNLSASSGLTPFPTFPVSLFRFWDVAYWAMLEPSKGNFNWTKMDGTIKNATSNGVEDFIFTFGHVPQWASTTPSDPCAGGEGPGSCTPPDMQAFDDFATQVVQRYCGAVKYYETWNEPNAANFWDGNNTELVTVAKHLYQIAKDPTNCGCTNGVCKPGGGTNPNEVILPSISSLNQASLGWLASFLSATGPNYPYADIASFHGYENGSAPENIGVQVQSFRQFLQKYGLDSLQLWNTEASWGEETSTVNQNQASWLMRYHTVQVAVGVSRFVWYAYDNCDWGTLWSISPCSNAGANPNTQTPPGLAYGVIETWLIGANVVRCDQYQNGLWVCELKRNGDYDAWMLWSSTGANIPVPTPKTFGLAVYRDWKNNVNTLPTMITVDQMPVLLEDHDF